MAGQASNIPKPSAQQINNSCQFIHLSNLLSEANSQVYQSETEQADTVSERSVSLFVLHTLPVCEVFTCNCLHGGEQHKFLSSPQACQTPLYLPSTERPYSRPITAHCFPPALRMTTHVHTSIGAAQEIPELHVCSRHTED